MKRLLILGGGGHGRVVADIAHLNGYENIGFLDDSVDCGALPFPRLGRCSDANSYISDSDFIVAIGNSALRRNFQRQIASAGGNLITLIHPRAVVASTAVIGRGSVVMAGAVINPNAQNKLEDITIKKLTHGNPTMKAKFDEARRKAADQGVDEQ